MYRMIKDNTERVVDTEAAKDKLIAEGYAFLKEKKAGKTKTGGEKDGEPANT